MAREDWPSADNALSGAPVAFIMHHTAGRGDAAGVVNFWKQQGRGYGSQYIMDRNGVIHDTAREFGYSGSNQILNGTGVGKGLNNSNVVGMEIIAKNDADVTEAQKQAAAAFIQARYPTLPVFGHGQVNAGHKEDTEGMGAVNAVMALRKDPTATAYTEPATHLDSPALSAIDKSAPAVGQASGPMSHEQFIRDYAAKVGVNPDVAVGVANAEGLRAWSPSNPNAGSYVDRTGGVPWSFGDFQLNTRNGMGVDAQKAGIDPRDPNQWQKADMFALDQMKAGGLGPWKGDKFAANYKGPVLGTSLTSTPQGIVDPSIVAHGGTSPPLDASGGTAVAAAPTAPTFGQSIASGDVGGAIKAAFTKPPSKDGVEQKSPVEKLGDAVGNMAPQKQAPAAPEPQPIMPVQDPNPGLAPAAQQLFSTVAASAARPLTWNARPYGYNAGFQGTTLNATDYGNG